MLARCAAVFGKSCSSDKNNSTVKESAIGQAGAVVDGERASEEVRVIYNKNLSLRRHRIWKSELNIENAFCGINDIV